MIAEIGTWGLVLTMALPLTGAGLMGLFRSAENRRRVAVAASAAQLASAVLVAAILRYGRIEGSGHAVSGAVPTWPGMSALRLDPISGLFLPLVAAIGAVSLLIRPRRRENDGFLRRALLAEGLLAAAVCCRHPPTLAVLWWGLCLIPLFELRSVTGERVFAHRLEAVYLLGSALLLSAGILLSRGRFQWAGTSFILLSVLCRGGLFPFQSWAPVYFERVPPGPAMLVLSPQLAACTTAVLLIPHGHTWVLWSMSVAAVITSVHAAAMGLVQRDARRALAWLFLSQSAGVFAGFAAGNAEGTTGGLAISVSCALAGTGLALGLWALEARRGRLDLARSHGGYDRMPLLASSFLFMGLALVGFPGTLGFVGQELVVDSTAARGNLTGLFLLFATALNGISVLRMYFRLFCGVRVRTPAEQRLQLRERVGFLSIVLLLILGGLSPRIILDSRVGEAGPTRTVMKVP